MKYNLLQLESYYGQRVEESECRLVFHVHGDSSFTLQDLRDHLLRALRITVDVDAQVDGPVDGVFVSPVALLDSLKRVERLG